MEAKKRVIDFAKERDIVFISQSLRGEDAAFASALRRRLQRRLQRQKRPHQPQDSLRFVDVPLQNARDKGVPA